MRLSKQSLEKLRDLINEATEYRSGPTLVRFFNDLGFNDTYGQGFPSRWKYTDAKLEALNGSDGIKKCIKKVLDPRNFIGKSEKLVEHISDLNDYLEFDDWKVELNGKTIDPVPVTGGSLVVDVPEPIDEHNYFLEREFKSIEIEAIPLDHSIRKVIRSRISEIERCFASKSYLSTIVIAGSTLEGVLLGVACESPARFNKSSSAPKDSNGKVKPFPEWSLGPV